MHRFFVCFVALVALSVHVKAQVGPFTLAGPGVTVTVTVGPGNTDASGTVQVGNGPKVPFGPVPMQTVQGLGGYWKTTVVNEGQSNTVWVTFFGGHIGGYFFPTGSPGGATKLVGH